MSETYKTGRTSLPFPLGNQQEPFSSDCSIRPFFFSDIIRWVSIRDYMGHTHESLYLVDIFAFPNKTKNIELTCLMRCLLKQERDASYINFWYCKCFDNLDFSR